MTWILVVVVYLTPTAPEPVSFPLPYRSYGACQAARQGVEAAFNAVATCEPSVQGERV